jgi:hypothetical protein
VDQMAVATEDGERKDLIVTRVFDVPVERT